MVARRPPKNIAPTIIEPVQRTGVIIRRVDFKCIRRRVWQPYQKRFAPLLSISHPIYNNKY